MLISVRRQQYCLLKDCARAQHKPCIERSFIKSPDRRFSKYLTPAALSESRAWLIVNIPSELTRDAELVLEFPRLLKHLHTVVVRIGHDYVLVHSEAEAMRGVELTLARPELSKLAPGINHTSVKSAPRVSIKSY